jgi:uncharacterized membrane protein YwaF
MMQVDVENAFNNIFQAIIFRALCDVKELLASIVSLTKLFYGVHFSFYYQHGRHVEGVTIIEPFSGTRQGDPLKSLLFVLVHYRTFLKTISWALSCVLPSLMDNIHIMGPMNEYLRL